MGRVQQVDPPNHRYSNRTEDGAVWEVPCRVELVSRALRTRRGLCTPKRRICEALSERKREMDFHVSDLRHFALHEDARHAKTNSPCVRTGLPRRETPIELNLPLLLGTVKIFAPILLAVLISCSGAIV